MKHIGNTEECKIFYGPRFEEMKKWHKTLRMRSYRKEDGIKKELEQQKKNYHSNPEVKERKNAYYEKEKEHQRILREKAARERRKKRAKESIIYHEERDRRAIEMRHKLFKWVIEFLHHFLETHQNVCKETERKINDIIKIIEDKSSKNMLEFEDMFRNAKNGTGQYNGGGT